MSRFSIAATALSNRSSGVCEDQFEGNGIIEMMIAPRQNKTPSTALRCPKCGKPADSLRCGHCGSQLPAEQADLYGAIIKKLAKMGGNRADAGKKGGDFQSRHNGDDPPRDNGGAATPQWLIERCNQLAIATCGKPITLDVAAAEWNHKCERYFTKEDDGLKQNWDAPAAWCNPPFSVDIIEQFVHKAIDAARQGTTTFCLLPWWNYAYLDLCEQHGRIHRICGPVTFQRENGTTTTLNSHYGTSQLVVVVFGPAIQPGFGVPIRRDGAKAATIPGDDFDAEGEQRHHTNGITVRAIVGDGDHRQPNDVYATPPWVIDSLLAVEQFPGLTWEPAEGDGRIVRALQVAGCKVVGSDLKTGTDFLATAKEIDNIVTNPPWRLKTAFIRHAHECAQHKVALLLPLYSLCGVQRRPLFESSEFPLRCLYVFVRRLNFHPEGQGSSIFTAGWFIWERGYQGTPVLRWI